MSGLADLGKLLMVFGGAIALMGLLVLALGRLGGRFLPGDIVIQRPGFTFVFPVVTSIVLSVILTLILWLITVRRR